MFNFCKSIFISFSKSKAVRQQFQYLKYFQCIFNTIHVNFATRISNILRHLPEMSSALSVLDRRLSDQQRLPLPFLQGLPRNLHLHEVTWHTEHWSPKRRLNFLPMSRIFLAYSDCTAFSDNCVNDCAASLLQSLQRILTQAGRDFDFRPSHTQTECLTQHTLLQRRGRILKICKIVGSLSNHRLFLINTKGSGTISFFPASKGSQQRFSVSCGLHECTQCIWNVTPPLLGWVAFKSKPSRTQKLNWENRGHRS